MNEVYAAEPTCFHSFEALRGLLRQFGPDTGRYLVAYPPNWSTTVIKNMSKHIGDVVLAGEIGPVQELKIKTMLQRAMEEHRVIEGDLPYVWNGKPWLDHALKLIPPSGRDLAAIVAANVVANQNVFTLDNLNIPPVAKELMSAQPQEFARVAKTLVSISQELIFVDPFVNPCKKDVYIVLGAIFKLIARSSCTSVLVYARENELVRNHTLSDLRAKMVLLRRESGLPPKCNLELRLVADKNRLHDRYLFSQVGGIEFGQGFQRLGREIMVSVGPMTEPILTPAIQCFIESKHDMRVVETLRA
jgi:hypothetical protein